MRFFRYVWGFFGVFGIFRPLRGFLGRFPVFFWDVFGMFWYFRNLFRKIIGFFATFWDFSRFLRTLRATFYGIFQDSSRTVGAFRNIWSFLEIFGIIRDIRDLLRFSMRFFRVNFGFFGIFLNFRDYPGIVLWGFETFSRFFGFLEFLELFGVFCDFLEILKFIGIYWNFFGIF